MFGNTFNTSFQNNFTSNQNFVQTGQQGVTQFNVTQSNLSQQPVVKLSDLKYNQLEQQNSILKSEIDKIYINCKEPMKDGLNEISKSQGSVPDKINSELNQIQLSCLKFENLLNRLRNETEIFKEMSKEHHRDAQVYGRNGIQQIKYRGGVVNNGPYPYILTEDLPIAFYHKALQRLEKRFEVCEDEIVRFSQQMKEISSSVNGVVANNSNQYICSKTNKFSSEYIVQLIQIQYTAFIRLAAIVADVNSQTEALKSKFLSIFYNNKMRSLENNSTNYKSKISGQHSQNPFEKADREEEIKHRRMQQKLKIDIVSNGHTTGQTSQPQSQQQLTQGGLNPPQSFQANQSQTSSVFSSSGLGLVNPSTNTAFGSATLGGMGGFGTGNPTNTMGGFGASLGGFGGPQMGGFGGTETSQSLKTSATTPITGFGGNGFGNNFSGGFGQPSATIAGLDLTGSGNGGDSTRKSKGKKK